MECGTIMISRERYGRMEEHCIMILSISNICEIPMNELQMHSNTYYVSNALPLYAKCYDDEDDTTPHRVHEYMEVREVEKRRGEGIAVIG